LRQRRVLGGAGGLVIITGFDNEGAQAAYRASG
jgi:hypothetical protein